VYRFAAPREGIDQRFPPAFEAVIAQVGQFLRIGFSFRQSLQYPPPA
jgi:hypothetical protein